MQGILLDRDGVINRERADYVKCWDEFTFLPGSLAALRRLAAYPMPIVVITNQSVIGRQLVSRAAVDAIHARAQQEIEAAGGRIDGFFLCPHHPAERCGCRKPQPGLLHQAAERFGLTMAQSIFVGDAITDYQAACAAGCRSILVESGRQGAQLRDYFKQVGNETSAAPLTNQQQLRESSGVQTAFDKMPPIVPDLAAAVDFIIAQATATSVPPGVGSDEEIP